MFFAVYGDEDRVLRYVNCGHNPPILLRTTGEIERLCATATVLGLFENWDCAVAARTLQEDDVLVMYTDGISEASPDEDHEFGEARLIEVIRAHRQQSSSDVLQAIVAEVQNFSQGVQADDMTLITARCNRAKPA
jgi:phosphoserine phosphatase RsbU/P